MPLNISRNDIRDIHSDVLVCPTDRGFSHGGGVDYIVHEMAGKELDEKCYSLVPLEEGQAVLTDAYGFENYKHIIHTRGPVYVDGKHDEEAALRSCYRNCLSIAKELSLASVTFPLISAGSFGFPKGEALRIATDEISSFLENEDMDIELLIYDKSELNTSSKLFLGVSDFLSSCRPPHAYKVGGAYRSNTQIEKKKSSSKRIAGNIVSPVFDLEEEDEDIPDLLEAVALEENEDIEDDPAPFERVVYNEKFSDFSESLDDQSFEPDQSFGEYLIDLIDQRGYKDSEVYKRANVNRDVFNKIINNKVKTPKKKTCVALAISLKLDLKETNELLKRAGYVLSDSYVFDQIISYCIMHEVYNIFDINEVLYANDQETLC